MVIRLPSPFAPGLRLIDGVRILPRHKLERALTEGTFNDAWSAKTPLTEIVSLGPFVLAEHVSGQRLVFTRNPHYWRKDAAGTALPYLDKLTVVVASQTTEALRLQSGEIDLMTNADIRPEDYAAFKRVSDEGRLRLIDNGVGLDPNLLWFNLTSKKSSDPKSRWFGNKAFRQAISCAVDRQAIVNTVYLGEAVPIYGPVTPANRTWFADVRPTCEHDPAKARTLFASAGLTDRNGDGTLEDSAGRPARFSVLTQADHIRARVVAVVQEQLRQVGIAVDVVPLDPNALFQRYTARQLRQHLLRHPGQRDRPGIERRLLAELGRLARLEPWPEDAVDRLGTTHRRPDGAQRHLAQSGGARPVVHRGAEDLRGRDAGHLLRHPQGDPRRQHSRQESATGAAASAAVVERRHAGGRRPAAR